MNSLLIDIAELLRKSADKEERTYDYIIKGVKTYYDIECSLKIAVKVLNIEDNKEEVIVLGGDYLGDLTNEDEQKWFEELN